MLNYAKLRLLIYTRITQFPLHDLPKSESGLPAGLEDRPRRTIDDRIPVINQISGDLSLFRHVVLLCNVKTYFILTINNVKCPPLHLRFL